MRKILILRHISVRIYPEGAHGMSLATPEVSGGENTKMHEHNRTWFDLELQWIDTVKPVKHFRILKKEKEERIMSISVRLLNISTRCRMWI